ncbi:MAG: phospholipase D-like domain-containing protein [Gammaproteobacteria bacterium]|nr:phospholipase D-like domain-containing protein [Gammaproteobacteria bacterium]
MRKLQVPEEAVGDATSFAPLGAAALLTDFADRGGATLRIGLLSDIGRKENLSPQVLEEILAALCRAGLIEPVKDGFTLAVSADDALSHSAVLRGVAYANFRHRDANQVEIALSPPAHPSRLMEILPKKGFAWARLYDTNDSLVELASQAERRLTVVSPFLDDEGLDWIHRLFLATANKPIARTIVVRGRDKKELSVLKGHRLNLASWNARILSYAVSHEPSLRSPPIETFHAKILLADSDKAYVGSANMTKWSRDYSMECGVMIRGPCVKPVATLVDAILEIAQQLTL